MTTIDDSPLSTTGPDEVVHTTVVLASSWDVLRYIGEPGNLPEYLPGVLAARRIAGDEILVSVKGDDGPEDVRAVLGIDESAHRLQWSVPQAGYRGSVVVDGGSVMTQLRLHLHAGRELSDSDHRQIQHVLGILRHQIEASVW